MPQLRKGIFQNPFHRRKKSGNAEARINQQDDGVADVLLPTSSSLSGSQPTESTQPTQSVQLAQSIQTFIPLDLWGTAYDQLDDEEQRILSTVRSPTNLGDEGNHSQTDVLVGEVIRLTEEQYEEYQQKASGKLRVSCRKIINAALSFKDVISAVAAFDPTQHAASAWAIVSLGLTMSKNHSDLRDALFESSEYLADILTQCAFIEKNFYHNSNFSIKDDLGNALVKLYRAILHYTAQIRKAQDPSMGRKLLDYVTAITEHPLTELKTSVENERENIFRWIGLVKHLHREKEAENILNQVDKLAESLKHLIEQFGLVNLRVAEGAFYDSYINEHEDFCLPGTRTELRSQISEWAESADGKCIFWMSGMAGTGKSTIARTVAQSFKDKGQLGATFFFKRGEADRGSAKYLIPTIARQLVTRHRWLVPDILSAIEKDPNISSKFLSEQFDKLLLQPLLGLKLDQPATVMVIIDALDECDRENDIRIILQLLFRLQEVKSVCLRIFLTSRPELPIRLGFRQSNNHQDLVLHELPKPVIERDIRLYLDDKFSTIREERSFTSNWPGDEVINELVQMSTPLFIFAATAYRFINGGRHPKRQLQKFLASQAATSASQMDKIYLPVLNQLIHSDEDDPTEVLKEFQDIIGTIILLATPLSITSLARLLHLPAEDITEFLDPLHSVLNIPTHSGAPVRILHLSFRDFLVNTTSIFHVDEKETHQKIVLHCLRIMDTGLKQNICGLSSYGTQRTNIDNEVINEHLSADLQYSCRYWVYHFEHSYSHITRPRAFDFVKKHFLHWLEALSLMGVISEAVAMMDILQSGAGEDVDAEFSNFLYDAKRFVLKYIYIASLAPLQLYCSGVVFLPMRSTIRKMFLDSRPKQIHMLPRVEDNWSPGLQTLEGHSDWVYSVAFSHDGQMVVSGSKDCTIKLWDAKTGSELQTLKGHPDEVLSVAFSHDGQIVASGAWDNTIKLWDAKTGSELQTVKGHLDFVNSVAFSPDSQILASGSYDKTIKLWDTKTGSELQTLNGHSRPVYPVAFSHDGQMVVSGSSDETIKLWDVKTGSELQALKGHSDRVYSVAFSHDDQMVVSGSWDNTIKLWDTETGSELQTLKGHLGYVYSVAFSHDSQMIASGSNDGTIKLWDVKTGSELQTLKGHSTLVHSVAFSNDDQMVVSGSWDNTIMLWDVKIRLNYKPLEGHSDSVSSVAFSHDGQMVASGSDDNTIKLWDTKTGSELQTLKGHSYRVRSVGFSYDGQMVASGSDDNTIKLWDVKTGSELQTLKGHSSRVYSVAFPPDGQIVMSGSDDNTIKFWDAKTGSELQTLKGHSDRVYSVAFSHDGQRVVSGSYDKTIKLWDVKTGSELQTLKGHSGRVYSVAFSYDSRMVASGFENYTIKLWDTETGSELQTLKGHSHSVYSVAFSHNGQTVMSGSWDNTIKLWDVKTGSELQTLNGHSHSVYSMTLSNSVVSALHAEELTSTQPTSIPQRRDNFRPTSHNFNLQVSLSDNWVALAGENILWLPIEHRPFTASAVKEATLALGYGDGRVSIIGFHTL